MESTKLGEFPVIETIEFQFLKIVICNQRDSVDRYVFMSCETHNCPVFSRLSGNLETGLQ